jgi:Fe-S cluster biosynthesis and repair protein YggX
MSETVHCQKYNKELEKLARPPFPGKRGEEIFQTLSKQAWQEWVKLQTMLINEKRLNVLDPETQKYLAEQRDKFLSNQEHDHASGYTPIKAQ